MKKLLSATLMFAAACCFGNAGVFRGSGEDLATAVGESESAKKTRPKGLLPKLLAFGKTLSQLGQKRIAFKIFTKIARGSQKKTVRMIFFRIPNFVLQL